MKLSPLKLSGLPVVLPLLVVAAFLLSACGGRVRPYVAADSIPRRVVVLDFAVAEEIILSEKKRERRSWWLGSHDVYMNENIGRNAPDALADVMGELPYVDVASRNDYRYYIEGKKRLLRTAFPSEIDEDIPEEEWVIYLESDYERMVQSIDPTMIGRDLGADVVVSGEIRDAYTGRNIYVDWTWSRVEMVVRFHEVSSGRLLGEFIVNDKDELASQLSLIRKQFRKKLPEIDQIIGRPFAAGK